MSRRGRVCVQVLQGLLCVCARVHRYVCTHMHVCAHRKNWRWHWVFFLSHHSDFFILLLGGVSYWPGTLQVAQAGFSSSGFKGKHYCSALMWVLGSYSEPQTYTASTLSSPGALKWTNLRQLRTFCMLWVPGSPPEVRDGDNMFL